MSGQAYNLHDGTPFSTGSNRIVSNDTPEHAGSYLEFSSDQITATLRFYYHALVPTDIYYVYLLAGQGSGVKVYLQLKTTWYADYIPGMFYVDINDLVPAGQLSLFGDK